MIESIKQGVRLIDTSLSSLAVICRALSHGKQTTIQKSIFLNRLILVLSEGFVKRSELFIVTKVSDIHHDRILESLDHQLSSLGIEYSDLHLIETPWELEAKSKDQIDNEYKTDNNDQPIFKGGEGIPYKKTTKLTDKWTEMERLYKEGRVKVEL